MMQWIAPVSLLILVALKYALHWEVDATYIALVALILFAWALIYLKIPAMIAAMLDQRSAAIAHELNEAKKLREQAAALLAEYQAKKAEAERHAQELIASAREQAKIAAAEIRTEAAASLKRREAQAEEKIARAEAQAVADVRAAAAEAAVAAAEKMLRAQLTPAKQADLVKQGAAELAKKFA
jgi:F-type H+-transporting ATPase subunit b